ncbi:tRNA methyltransferase [Baekduia alba]|uniref:class I SAM-dependent methyltransferase n=1 Tax=Baekduia alba TaxID=2997333 RepID=UPI00234048F2|nr:class I SAM-dependent methyltransferase [Baekduia alba]WCB93131.1 tRNA methyltransferase [Baekduia alba]
MCAQFHFDPDTYDALMASDVPAYARLQRAVAEACGSRVGADVPLLELGTGTGETAVHVLAAHPGATLIGVDASEAMLARAAVRLPGADLRVARLQDELPEPGEGGGAGGGGFAVVFSALAVHHLDGPEKAELFARVADVLAPGGRFVLGDLIVPTDARDVVTPIDGVFDQPSTIEEQLGWLRDAGLTASVAWAERDLAVLLSVKPEAAGAA